MLFILTILLLVGCSTGSPSWAYGFVKWDGETYVSTDSEISENNIGNLVGEVTRYSTKEGSYSGDFSNQYEKGAKYYEIKGINTDEAIAIKNDKGVFIKAIIKEQWEAENLNK